MSKHIAGVMLAVVALLGAAACDAPMGLDERSQAVEWKLEAGTDATTSMSMAMGTATFDHEGTRYDVGCPMQCELPQGVVTILEGMVADGTLMIHWGRPAFVYVTALAMPVFLQNPRAIPECANGIDDDSDGRVDWPADPGCRSKEDPDETDDPPPFIKLPPIITAPAFVVGRIPFKGELEWYLECPLKAVLQSLDERTWTPLGVRMDYTWLQFKPAQGWVVTGTESVAMLDRADVANSLLTAAGWWDQLHVPNREARIRLTFRLLGDDGEELMVPANDGTPIFCGF